MIDFQLSKAEQAAREEAHEIAEKDLRPFSLECDRTESIPDEFFWRMKRRAATRTPTPQGESQQSRRWAVLGVLNSEETAWGDAGLATGIPGPGLAAPPILAFGSDEQRKRFLSIYEDEQPRWGALALSEPGVGSDVSSIATLAKQDGDDWVLNGTKHFITNGARADLVVVFATINPEFGRAGIRPFVVPKGTPGFTVGRIEKKMGLRASQTAQLFFTDCRIPGDHLLAGRAFESMAGFKAAMGTLDATRPMVGSLAVGIARAAHEVATAWVCDELPQGYPFARKDAVVEELEDLGARIDAARLLCWRAAWMADHNLPNSKEASMAKAYAGQLVMQVTSAAARIMGPAEDCECKQLVEKWFRDAKVFDIFEGTAQVQRLVISRRMFGDAGPKRD
ncbi:MAG TPA: acyl-CoA dehydrogenase family protein [Ktedonobacterales bacterium]|jgi:acyl-CoA dehydrogenase